MAPTRDSSLKSNCIKFVKIIFSTAGLFFLNAAYVTVGGVIFSQLESENELHECFTAESNYGSVHNASTELLLEVANKAGNGLLQQTDGRTVLRDDFSDVLRAFTSNVIGIGYNVSRPCSRMGLSDGPQYKWTFSGALVFAMTVTTTIGYGVLSPRTLWGKVACVGYLIVGVPIMLICLADVGSILANIFRYIYATVCCCGCCQPRQKKNEKQNQQDVVAVSRYDDSSDESDDDDDYWTEEDEDVSVPLTISVLSLLSLHHINIMSLTCVVYLLRRIANLVNGKADISCFTAFNFLGAAVFAVMENWTMVNSFYYCFTTFTTIGFGDVVPGVADLDDPKASTKLIAAGIYQILGMAWISMCFQLMQNELVAKAKWIAAKLGGNKKAEVGGKNSSEKDSKKKETANSV